MSSLLELIKWSKIVENALLNLGLHSSAMHDGNPFPATRPCWTAVREPEYILSPVTCVKVVAHAPCVEVKWKLQKKVLRHRAPRRLTSTLHKGQLRELEKLASIQAESDHRAPALLNPVTQVTDQRRSAAHTDIYRRTKRRNEGKAASETF
ncbi:hypothetical protein E4U60_000427 [Claviceps pazoutovae]|uniref:Uncharacterized protein n=1 Tax=Claviceps pazoutovae TaxID=1649127 RepID=A0A9P7MDQ2_9HYPO|nr:hypothetical protein E4U60_000427 [Claviceps pazoutovae]